MKNHKEHREYVIKITLDTITTNKCMVEIFENCLKGFISGLRYWQKAQTKVNIECEELDG